MLSRARTLTETSITELKLLCAHKLNYAIVNKQLQQAVVDGDLASVQKIYATGSFDYMVYTEMALAIRHDRLAICQYLVMRQCPACRHLELQPCPHVAKYHLAKALEIYLPLRNDPWIKFILANCAYHKDGFDHNLVVKAFMQRENTSYLKPLVDWGFDVNHDRAKLLRGYVSKSDHQTVRQLLELGAGTAATWYRVMRTAVTDSDVQMVQLLQQHRPYLLKAKILNDVFILSIKIDNKMLVMQYLLQLGSIPHGASVATAVKYNNMPALQYLHQLGADIHTEGANLYRQAMQNTLYHPGSNPEPKSLSIMKYLALNGVAPLAYHEPPYATVIGLDNLDTVIKAQIQMIYDFVHKNSPLKRAAALAYARHYLWLPDSEAIPEDVFRLLDVAMFMLDKNYTLHLDRY